MGEGGGEKKKAFPTAAQNRQTDLKISSLTPAN